MIYRLILECLLKNNVLACPTGYSAVEQGHLHEFSYFRDFHVTPVPFL